MFMIDYVKLQINSKIFVDNLRRNQLINIKNESDDNTGELEKQRAKYRNIQFLLYPDGKVIIEGSLHKYYNEGIHNFNDFGFSELQEVIKDLSQKFDLEPQTAFIHGFEFGVNILTDLNPSEVLKMIVFYGKNSVNKMTVSANNSDGIICKQTNHVLKIYNKGLQYKQPENILRVEEKILRMRKIEHLNFKTLHDLTIKHKIESLGKPLLEMFEMLIIHEPINQKELSKPDLKLYEQAGNPRYWESLSRSQRCKKRAKYEALIQTYSTTKVKETLKLKIAEKWDAMLKNGYEYTGLEKTLESYENTGSIEGIRNHLFDNTFVFKKYCLSCGRDITHQRVNSKFCSEKYFGKIAKSCRNKDSNPRNNPKNNFLTKLTTSKRRYNSLSIPLFSDHEILKINKG